MWTFSCTTVFTAECEAAGMKISSSKSEAMVLNWKECSLWVGDESLPHAEELKYLGILFTSDGRLKGEKDRRTGVSSAVSSVLLWSVMMKRELSQKTKLSIYWSIFVPNLTYGHEICVVNERMRMQIWAEMGFLWRVAGLRWG